MAAVKATSFTQVATTDELPPGVMRKVVVDSTEVLLANLDGKYYAIANLCTHHGGPLDESTLRSPEVECPWHGSRFDLRTGMVTHGPAVSSEPSYEVRIEGNKVLIRPK